MLRSRARTLSNPRDIQEPFLLIDPGNHPDSHFQKRMSPIRYAIRSHLVQFTTTQSGKLAKWQSKHRTPLLDVFFSYTAIMGSHTFYVVCLPMPVWLGQYEVTKDLVYILGYSIYLSGFFKDFCCLPRPRAPPLHRITLSKYTEKEYGAPSSHCANATGVTLYVIWRLFQNGTFSWFWKLVALALVSFYYFTLVIGRVYCGMHGMLDLISGAIIGVICMVGTILLKYFLKYVPYETYWWFPLWSVLWGLFLLFYHIEPVDECPCFADSVAFIGVVVGLELGDWTMHRWNWAGVYEIYYSGLVNCLGKFVVGVTCVVIWKYLLSKPIVYWILINVFKISDDRKENSKELEKRIKQNDKECPLFVGFPKIDIIGRYIIYAGIPLTVLLVTPKAISLCGL